MRATFMTLPSGISPSVASLPIIPWATSPTVPSPPAAMINVRPLSTSARASSVAWPARSVVSSSNRTPAAVMKWTGDAKGNGMKVIIAAAGGAAHLAGVVAAHTTIPVLGVPMPSKHLGGLDSLLSTVQMPKGIPVPTLAIGEAGAANAALAAVAIIALSDAALSKKLDDYRAKQTEAVLKAPPLKL